MFLGAVCLLLVGCRPWAGDETKNAWVWVEPVAKGYCVGIETATTGWCLTQPLTLDKAKTAVEEINAALARARQ